MILLGVGNTIGAGVFAYTGLAAKYAGGPAAWFAYFIAGIVSSFTALVFAEFGSRIPKSGSSYLFAQIYLGEFISWVIAWNLNLRYTGTAAPVARGFASFVVKFFKLCGITLPPYLNNYKIWGCETSIIAPIFLLMCTAAQNKGTKTAGNLNNAITFIKIVILAFMIIVSFCNFSYEKNFTPFISPTLGYKGVIVATTKCFYAYVGYDFITTMSEETIKPEIRVPKGIFGCLAITAFFYCLVSFSANGVGNLSVAI